MTFRQRLVSRFAPFYGLWRAERRRSAAVAVELAEAKRELAAAKAHLALAQEQRERALAAAMGAEWTADDVAWLHDCGVDG